MQIEAAGRHLTPRELRDFINKLPAEALDVPIVMTVVDGTEGQVVVAYVNDGALRLV